MNLVTAQRRVCFCVSQFLVLVLTGCGGNYYSSKQGAMTSSQASLLAPTLANSVRLAFNRPPDSPQDSSRVDFSSCTTTDPVSPVDTDGDGIPATSTSQFDCHDIADGATTFHRVGSFSVQDYNDADVFAGYHFQFKFQDLVNSNASAIKETFRGTFDLALEGGSYRYTTNYQASGSQSQSRSYDYKWEYGSSWDHTFVPKDAKNPGDEGSATLQGYYGYRVTFSGNPPADSESADFVVEISSSGLKYQGSNCDPFFSDGTILFADGSGNTLQLAFTCSGVSHTYNGAPL